MGSLHQNGSVLYYPNLLVDLAPCLGQVLLGWTCFGVLIFFLEGCQEDPLLRVVMMCLVYFRVDVLESYCFWLGKQQESVDHILIFQAFASRIVLTKGH